MWVKKCVTNFRGLYSGELIHEGGAYLRNFTVWFLRVYSLKLMRSYLKNRKQKHCVKNVQMRSFFRSVFPRIRTEYEDLLRKKLRFGHFSHIDS